MLKFCDFIQVYVFTTNHHLNCIIIYMYYHLKQSAYFLSWFGLVSLISKYAFKTNMLLLYMFS